MDLIDKAFRQVKRRDFVPEDLRGSVNIDAPLPIGFGQTISQPTTVRMMLEWLEAQPGDKVLDIGSGSGWTTALLAQIVGPKGKIFAVELIPELLELGRENCQRVGVKNARFFQTGDKFGLAKFAPYNRILVNAAAQKLPEELIDQLTDDGKLIIPVNYDILEIEKTGPKTFETKVHPGFVFVPLVGKS